VNNKVEQRMDGGVMKKTDQNAGGAMIGKKTRGTAADLEARELIPGRL